MKLSTVFRIAGVEGVNFFILWGPSILIAVCLISLFLWRCNSQGKTKSHLVGAASGHVGILIWPMGWVIYILMTNLNFLDAGFGGNFYLYMTFSKLLLLASIASVAGGLITLFFAILFLNPDENNAMDSTQAD